MWTHEIVPSIKAALADKVMKGWSDRTKVCGCLSRYMIKNILYANTTPLIERKS